MPDLDTIPEILLDASMQDAKLRTLKSYCELLQLAYDLSDHPVLQAWNGHESIDLFDIADFNPETFKHFNRTLIERTISQATYYSTLSSDRGLLTLSGKGIEYCMMTLESFYITANKLYHSTDAELNDMSGSVHYFRLDGAGKVSASIKCFLEVCNDMIALTITHYISDELKKISADDEKVKFLLRKKADFGQMEDQFTEKVFKKISDSLDLELSYHQKVKEYIDIPSDLRAIVQQFLAERKARISSNKLLGFLMEEQLDEFSKSLSELVMEMFSYHDIGTHEPEKVYHAFLLGVFNGFKDTYRLKSNKEAGTGRFDIMLIPETLQYKGLIIEIKRSSSGEAVKIDMLLDEALRQIVDNGYATDLKSAGHTAYIALAAVFHGKSLTLKFRINSITQPV